LKIGDPAELFGQLDRDDMKKVTNRFGRISKFLKPGDTFRFTCDKSGYCCKDRFDNPIVLSTYDIARLRRRLKITTGALIKRHAILTFGGESQLPLAMLKFEETKEYRNKCPFLRSYGCKVYEDRPLRCRLYPVGRAVGIGNVSYFFLMDTPAYCGLDKGKEHTLEEWLKECQVEPYLFWSDKFFAPLFEMDHVKYRDGDSALKIALGKIMYDFDDLVAKLVNAGGIEKPENDDQVLTIALAALKKVLDIVSRREFAQKNKEM
jgi:Fe-S-cluster containining protein